LARDPDLPYNPDSLDPLRALLAADARFMIVDAHRRRPLTTTSNEVPLPVPSFGSPRAMTAASDGDGDATNEKAPAPFRIRPSSFAGATYRVPALVARGRNYTWTTSFTVPIEVRVA
jgi:hypothetical protein